jgi:hypothetical protein
MAVTGKTYKDLPPYSTVYWHYKQWRGRFDWETDDSTSWGNPRAGKKKKEMDHFNDRWLASGQKILVMRVLNRKAFADTRQPMGLKGT